MIKVAILGGSGYTGLELLRLLATHTGAEITLVTSRQNKGKKVAEVFPSLGSYYPDIKFSAPEDYKKINADAVFTALPHGASQEVVPELLSAGKRVIDLSADYRLKNPDTYKAWYGEHSSVGLLSEAVYGLPELYREKIKTARLVANPGCYPTSAILALAPLAKRRLMDASVIIDSKSGASGAGRKAAVETSFVEVAGGFKAYKIGSHRHTPEMEQEVTIQAGEQISVTFTPHLLPVSRGILSTVYANVKSKLTTVGLHALYKEFYQGEQFVRVMDIGSFPDISQVRGSNYCDIGVHADEKTGRVIIISVIDNLVKGASGQAVQNMNIMFGIKEDTGLTQAPLAV